MDQSRSRQEQLQSATECLTREKSELDERLGSLEQQLEALRAERLTIEKSVLEANTKLEDQTAQRTYIRLESSPFRPLSKACVIDNSTSIPM